MLRHGLQSGYRVAGLFYAESDSNKKIEKRFLSFSLLGMSKPFEFNCLIPEFSVSDFKESLEFYTQVLGFKIQYERKEERFAFLCLGQCQIMIEAQNENWKIGKLEYPYGRGINFQIEVKDVGTLYSKIKGFDYPIKFELEEKWYRSNEKMLGVKQFLILDPDGYLLRFCQGLGSKMVTGNETHQEKESR